MSLSSSVALNCIWAIVGTFSPRCPRWTRWWTMPTRLYILKRMAKQQKANIERSAEAARIWEARRAEILSDYVNGPAAQADMAMLYGVSQQALQKALKRLGIAPKPRGRPGAANGRYKDGTTSTVYRKMVEKRECNRCGSTEQLVIHHRDGVHTNNEPGNLEVLCSPCHTSHHKQEWWDARRASAS